ncbi:STKc_myosinIII_N_like and MYSc_Myo21 domain-containing protein ninaC isoform X3 [Lasioglossum baleicum]|uniref:STKc_myosinIII_N_like and MYSc_Myo21 domain-containing protein ninaC isoform X3 n=1 Tax=Lasioglossum baleicum TaxID=434251 RepID=UPI003FCD09FC
MNDYGYGKRPGKEYDRRGGGSRSEDEYEERDRRINLQRLDSVQDPGKRYLLRECIGSGVCGDVFEAIDQNVGNKKIAVKVQKLTAESQPFIVEEYKVLRDLASHPNLPDFYGIYRRRSGKKTEYDQIWFVMELCDGGTALDLVRGLVSMDKKLREEHIGHILKEVIKAVMYLHENNVMHRDIRASNILLTKEGEVKLCDFGLSRAIQGEMGKRYTCVGSPCWMAPELAISKESSSSSGYGNRADVWAIGITAIELADGKPPFQDMHPTRALFQIVRNPPPNLYRPSNWTQTFNDFIAECLEKNPDNRPFMTEIFEHPFLSELPDNDYLKAQELKVMMMDACPKGKLDRRPEVLVRKGFLKTHQTDPLEPMFMEDVAALESLTEDAILDELHERLRQGYFHSFVGDILLILNPNEQQDIYGSDYHTKYQFKSRSDNAPHIYSVADSAYQDVLHNEEAQNILLAGESSSGKTTNMLHLIRHLMYLGKVRIIVVTRIWIVRKTFSSDTDVPFQSLQDVGSRVFRAIKVIHAFCNAATPLNPNSTRCILQMQATFGSSGKASGGIFWLYQLEKWRVSTRDRNQSNFHVFYYFYDGLDSISKLNQYHLPPGRRARYLRISDKGTERKRSFKVRNDPRGNVVKFDELKENLRILEMEEYCETIWKTLAAILTLGEIRFVEGNNGEAEMDNSDPASRVSKLLNVDEKKFSWALVNYCAIVKGTVVRRKHTCDEAKDARDVLANTIYQRLVDWIVNTINQKFTVTRALFGDKYAINVMDLFGFECVAVNRLEQLIVNTMNEQMQCYYNQRVFAWEMVSPEREKILRDSNRRMENCCFSVALCNDPRSQQEQEEEDIPGHRLHFYDNKDAIDQLMSKDRGLFSIIDDASKNMLDYQYILSKIQQQSNNLFVKPVSSHEFTVAHYTGKVMYDSSEIAEKNRDFIPPEMIETFRQSSLLPIKEMFTNKLTKSGNLTIVVEHPKVAEKKTSKGKWGALMQETSKPRKFNTASRGQYSQTRKVRTSGATFKAISLEILKNLSGGGASGGIHFVRCIRSDLEGAPRGFYREVVRQQIRALAILDTAKARQRGYPCRITFQEFLRRYQFLAFDFDENVEITKDNCRLLLIRLKMEGWMLGKTKVFLKYYNEEYLSRLYETQVKKIIKVQCMMRAFLAKKNMTSKIKGTKKEVAYRGHVVRKETAPLLGKTQMSPETMDMMKFYSSKWRSKSMFQVLLRYRAARYQDLVQFSQQVHLFNQAIVATLGKTNERTVSLDRIDTNVSPQSYLGQMKPPQVHKLPFNFYSELPFFDMKTTRQMKGLGSASSLASDDEHEAWDAPLRRHTVPWAIRNTRTRDVEVQTTNSPHRVAHSGTEGKSLIDTPFSRDPNTAIRCPPEKTSGSRMGNSGYQQSSSSNRSPAPSANAHNPRSNDYDSIGSTRSRKNAPPPPLPFNQTQPPPPRTDRFSTNPRSKSNVTTGSNDWEFDDRTNRNAAGNPNRINPIQELQMMGRRNHNDDNEDTDDPPFNFQAMLRKTGHQRASMKRNPVYDSYSPSPLPGSGYRGNRDTESNVVYRSGGSRRDSAEWSPNEMVRMSEKYGKEEAWGEDRTEDRGHTAASDSVTTAEIAPGIVIEGYVAEL